MIFCIFCLQAFPLDSPACFWYEAHQTELLTSVPGSTRTTDLFAKLKEHFANLDADPDKELQDLTFNSCDDLSIVAHKNVKFHEASTVSEGRAVLMLLQKVKHLQELHQHMLQVYMAHQDESTA